MEKFWENPFCSLHENCDMGENFETTNHSNNVGTLRITEKPEKLFKDRGKCLKLIQIHSWHSWKGALLNLT